MNLEKNDLITVEGKQHIVTLPAPQSAIVTIPILKNATNSKLTDQKSLSVVAQELREFLRKSKVDFNYLNIGGDKCKFCKAYSIVRAKGKQVIQTLLKSSKNPKKFKPVLLLVVKLNNITKDNCYFDVEFISKTDDTQTIISAVNGVKLVDNNSELS